MRTPFRRLMSRRVSERAIAVRHRLLAAAGHRPVLIYTMGKVGSTTVYDALRRAKVSSLVYHIHFLTDPYIKSVTEKYESAGMADRRPTLRELIDGHFDHLAASRALRSIPTSEGTVILSLVRDPVAAQCSFLFQNPKIHRPHLMGPDGRLDPERVRQSLLDYFTKFDPDSDYIANWFDREFIATSGIDIYRYPFDHSAGCCFIRQSSCDVGLLTLESLDSSLGGALQTLFGSSLETAPEKANRRSASQDGELYREILKDLVLPEECLRRIYSTRFASHFYSPEQIERMVEKWARNQTPAKPAP